MCKFNSKEDIERAWEIYNAADNILHQRLGSFLLSQAFLFGVYAILFSSDHNNRIVVLSIAELTFIALGILSCKIFLQSHKSILSKMIHIRNEILDVNDCIWEEYMYLGSGRQKNNLNRHLDQRLPKLFLWFWFSPLLLTVATSWQGWLKLIPCIEPSAG